MGCSWGGFWGAHRMPVAAGAGTTQAPSGRATAADPDAGGEGEVRRGAVSHQGDNSVPAAC